MKRIQIHGGVALSRARRLMLATTALCMGAIPAMEARAQTASENSVETVIVTAQKRTEELKNVPASISALSDKLLKRMSADSLESFANSVPGLEMQTFAPGQTRITMRGISPDEQTGVTTVSYYLDEIPITAAAQRSQPEAWLYDVERVEVLRGPQGTLYGEGAMGGTVRVITAKPDTNEFSASGLANVYTVNRGGTGYKLDGMVNVPIIDDVLALRVVVENRFNAGWIDSTIYDIPDPTLTPPARYVVSHVDKDANHSRDTSVRATLRFTPTSKMTVDATYIYDKINSHTSNIGTVDIYNNVDVGLRPTTDRNERWNLTASYDFDAFSVTSATSYTNRETNASLYQEPILLGSTLLGTFREDLPATNKTFTQELRAVSASDQPFRWTLGAYYRNGWENSVTEATGYVPTLGITVPVFAFNTVVNYNTYAFFGQGEYDLTSALTLIGGGRWFSESQNTSGAHRTTTGFTPLATVRYKFDDSLMAYATFSEGYRSGGFNLYAGPQTYAPDKTKNYEIGAKYVSPDNRLSLSGALYYIDWSNMQFTQLDSGGFFTYVGNANKASSRGIEVSGEYHWDNGFWGQLNASYTDAHLNSDVLANLGGVSTSGTELPAVPPYKVSVIAGYDTIVFDDYGLELTADVSFIGSQHTKLEQGGTYTLPGYGTFVIGSEIGAYSTGNLRAELSKDNYTLALYARNVWNTTTPIGNDNFFPALGQAFHYLQPRTIGLEVAAKW